MTTISREILRGLAGGVGFLTASLVISMPWWLAGLMGVGLYAGMSFLLPAQPQIQDSATVAPGITAKERDEFVEKCSASAVALSQIARQLNEGNFRTGVQGLAYTTASLTKYFQQKPESILSALAVPTNLDHLLKMLRQYLELSQFPTPGATVEEALQKVEETVEKVSLAFEGMYQQLLDNDVAALQVSASSLEYLLGADADLERERRARQERESREPNKSSAESLPPKPRQMEKPL
jgi:hypothetical protein